MEMEKMIIPMYVPDREIAKATSYLSEGKERWRATIIYGDFDEGGEGSGGSDVDVQVRVHEQRG